MTRIARSADCGNSPKNRLIEDLAIALQTGEMAVDLLVADVEWRRADGATIVGRDAVLAAAKKARAPATIASERVCSHGKVGAASGRAGTAAYAHYFEFASAAMKAVTRIDSYSKVDR